MPFYKDHVYHHLVTVIGNPKPIQKIRQRIVPLAQGTVLEIGVGPGRKFPSHDPLKVNKLFALEPNPGMIRRAQDQGRRTKLDIEFLDLPGERDGCHVALRQEIAAQAIGNLAGINSIVLFLGSCNGA